MLLEVLELAHVEEQFRPSKHGSGLLLVEGSDVGLQILDVSVNILLDHLMILGIGGVELTSFYRILNFPIWHHAFLLWNKEAGL